MLIGCHVSIAGGVFNAPERAAELGAEAMQIFTRSPQGGKAPELTQKILSQFKEQITRNKIQKPNKFQIRISKIQNLFNI